MYRKLVFISLMFLLSSYAFACKPAREAYDLEAYLSQAKTNVYIFEARVLKVQTFEIQDGLREQNVILDVHKQWLGARSERINVRAFSDILGGTSCSGTFDVVMTENEDWLVIAELTGSTLKVMPMLSQKLNRDQNLDSKLRIIEEHVRLRSALEAHTKN
jgi:hypothetical protein